MPEYSLNCEGFTIRMGNVARPTVKKGIPVHRFNWSDGEILPYEDRFYVDFADTADGDERRLTMALDDGSARPRMRHLTVAEFSLSAELLRDPMSKGNFDVPIRLSKPVARPVGRAALLGILDFNPYSFQIGAANLAQKGSSIEMDETRSDSKGGKAGVSVVLMPEDTLIVLRQEYRSGTPDTDFAVHYFPNSSAGILIHPMLGGGEERQFGDDFEDRGGGPGKGRPPRGKTDGGDDRFGSDRVPRRPIIPSLSGAAELVEPLIEDSEQADAVMPFRETG